MPDYMILIYDDEAAMADATAEEFGKLLEEHGAFMADHASVLRGGNAVHPSTSARSIRRDRVGDVVVTDGPFISATEAVGGYYMIEADDLEQAVAVAERVPARFGGVEVRPVRVLG
jgi:hypothetical protein